MITGTLEIILLRALWDLEEGGIKNIVVGEIKDYVETLPGEPKRAYTTIQTCIARMVSKGQIRYTGTVAGGKNTIESIYKRPEAQEEVLQFMLTNYFDNDPKVLRDKLEALEPFANGG